MVAVAQIHGQMIDDGGEKEISILIDGGMVLALICLSFAFIYLTDELITIVHFFFNFPISTY